MHASSHFFHPGCPHGQPSSNDTREEALLLMARGSPAEVLFHKIREFDEYAPQFRAINNPQVSAAPLGLREPATRGRGKLAVGDKESTTRLRNLREVTGQAMDGSQVSTLVAIELCLDVPRFLMLRSERITREELGLDIYLALVGRLSRLLNRIEVKLHENICDKVFKRWWREE